ncbi:MAG: 1-acyl-sn-glycerol-3-phosphate acyltransferase [Spirochaetes bacterium]|nr:1-acyl-sn-glycerol-3-phosphate acyltransferase [Spirochaetota bacterium]
MAITRFLLFCTTIIFLGILYLPLLLILFPWHRKTGPFLLQRASRIFLLLLKVKVEFADRINPEIKKNKRLILLANHVNILDIFLLSSYYRSVFVSKAEIMYYPVFGQVAWLMGTVFLQRSSTKERHKLIRTIADKADGRIVSIFPQGTTSSFTDPLPFKRGIFKSVEFNRDTVLVPVTLHYRESEDIIWTDDQSLIKNIWEICKINGVNVRIRVHREITSSDYETSSITEICRDAQQRVLTPLWNES